MVESSCKDDGCTERRVIDGVRKESLPLDVLGLTQRGAAAKLALRVLVSNAGQERGPKHTL